MKFFVYGIYNKKHGKLYIGQTFDIGKRLVEHNTKIFRGYTSRFNGDWVLIYTEETTSREAALRREKQLKSFRGREYLKQYIPW